MAEAMEIDAKAPTFEELKLSGLSDITKVEGPQKFIDGNLDVQFCNFICKLCDELAGLSDVEESVAEISSEDAIEAFMFDLSAFLTVLGCPYEEICTGPMKGRLASRAQRETLINYLLRELKAARIIASRKIHKQSEDTRVITELSAAANTLGITIQPNSEITDVLDKISKETNSRLQQYQNPPIPLFEAKIDEKRATALNEIAKQLSTEYRNRKLLLLKRVDVTVNSFLWNDRMRVHETNIKKLFAHHREQMAVMLEKSPTVAEMMAAGPELLVIEKASSGRRRLKTVCPTHPLALGERPKDRGGRVGEVPALKTESFEQQRAERGGFRGGRGGGGRGRGGGWQHGHRGGGNRQSQESQVRNEYSQRTHDGGGREGRGGHRGHNYRDDHRRNY